MHTRIRSSGLAVLLVLGTVAAAEAQQADLRYAAPLPQTVVFTTIDTIESTIMGLPTGDMTTGGSLESRSELRFTVAGDSITAAARLLSLNGQMSTPMGNMPLTVGEMPAGEFSIGPTGAPPEALAEQTAPSGMSGDPGQMLGAARAVGGLLLLPGRALNVGESWADTVMATPELQPGITADLSIIISGTYAGDTIVDGVTLNRLDITTSSTVKVAGNIQGMDMMQTTTTSSEEKVLWDSVRHVPMLRDATVLTTSDTNTQGMTMRVEGRNRSITTAELKDG